MLFRARSKASLYAEIDELRREVTRWKGIADCAEEWATLYERQLHELQVRDWQAKRATEKRRGRLMAQRAAESAEAD